MAYDEMNRLDYENTVNGLKEKYEEKIEELEGKIEEGTIRMRECADSLESVFANPTCNIGTYTKKYHLVPIIEKLRGGTK